MSNTVKILDIQINIEAINQALVARRSGYSRSYVNELLSGIKDSYEAKKVVRDTIVSIYGDAVKRIPSMGKINTKSSKTLLKKIA